MAITDSGNNNQVVIQEYFEWNATVDRYWHLHSTVAIAIAGLIFLGPAPAFEDSQAFPRRIALGVLIFALEWISYVGIRNAYIGMRLAQKLVGPNWAEIKKPLTNFKIKAIHVLTAIYLLGFLFIPELLIFIRWLFSPSLSCIK